MAIYRDERVTVSRPLEIFLEVTNICCRHHYVMVLGFNQQMFFTLFVSFCFENLQKGNMENTTVQLRPAIRGGIGISAHASAGIWLRQYCQK